ncbi:M1 family metallopeptidase [Halpernia frigidisoli]|uniref:Aminopeptidase N n=1 Tax=Halpernia frigidisoli TaxID=1125876 RepID=A0A1I3FKG7_9FLAO|nr:M1 family metallopeptidase [Halpernia frigidisoli]SFI11622.1 aminopeptidase N [Halpernia frigidisoli]
MKKFIISVSLLGILVSTNAIAQTDTSGATVYRQTHTKHTELKHTKLKVSFDYAKEQMAGEEWLTASPYFYPTDSLVLDAKGMLISEVALTQNGKNSPLKFDYKNDILKINLDKTYNRNQDYTVYIKYTARPNEVKGGGSAAITDNKGLYFINPQGKDPDKPTQIWTQGETESSSAWFPTIDKPNQKTTNEIYMTVPSKYVTLSNGVLKDSKDEGNNLRTDHWVMDKRHSTYLLFMGIGDFAIVKDKWKNMPVDYYVEKEYEKDAKGIFGNTPEMIDFYSTRLNYPFPWQKYSQMVGRDYVSGAMENTTATLHGEGAYQKAGDLIDENKWEDTIAHELFHQWFGDLVTAESWSNLTVNESFANYSEYLWEEHKYGKDAADYHEMNDINGYKRDPKNADKNLVRFQYDSREDVFDGVTYNKGGGILNMLRRYLGDDAFFSGLNDYLKTNEYGNGEAQQLRLSFEKISGKDLSWFFNQWYYGSGQPKISYTYSYEPVKKEVTVSIAQTDSKLFQFPLDIDVFVNGVAKKESVWVDAKAKNSFTFSAAKSPDLINLNPDGVIVSDITETKTPEQYYTQFFGSKDFKAKYLAIEDASKNASKNPSALKTLVAGLKDPFFRLKIQALEGLDLTNADEAKMALSEVEKLAQNDPKTLVQSSAISALVKTKNAKYLPWYEKNMSALSNAVKASSLAGIASLDPAKVVALADKLDLSTASEDLMMTLLPTIVDNKITAQMPAIGSLVAFYPFLKFQKLELGTKAEEGFNWIMTSDNTKATHNITKVLMQAKGQVEANPQAKMMIVKMLQDGLAKKTEILKANPSSASLKAQVEDLNKTIEAYK